MRQIYHAPPTPKCRTARVYAYDSQQHVVLLLLPIPEQLECILTCQWSLTMCGLLMVLQCLSIAFCSTKSVLEQYCCKVRATEECHNKIHKKKHSCDTAMLKEQYTRVGTLIVATIYLQLIQNRYMFRSFTVL